MKMPNRAGGGAQTNVNGLRFEQTTDLATAILQAGGFEIRHEREVFRCNERIGLLCGKHGLYNHVLIPHGVDYKDLLSKKLLPDEGILVGDTVYIIEKKFQSAPGSVDEKLQTCDFKKKQYGKILTAAGLKVEYIYVLNSWFRKKEYADVLNYIHSVGCWYYFDEIPLSKIGL